MKKLIVLSAALLGTLTVSAQDINGIWHTAPEGTVRELGAPALKSESFSAFAAPEAGLQEFLASAPSDPNRAIRMVLPTPDGNYRNFRIWSTPVLAPELAARYPGIRTYTAELEGNRRVTAKIDYTHYGFHAVVFDGDQTYLINPYGPKANGFYTAAFKRDITRAGGQYMTCGVGDHPEELAESGELPAARTNGTTRKTYRLAVSCTGEYAVAVDGATPTKAGVLSKMVTTVNRVNGVYERELAVTLTLVANNDALIYLNGTTDPFSNNSSGAMLTENTATINTIIGSANYDIGHVFSTGGGGLASLGSVCGSSKARGVTGSASPMGDSYDIDYVAHEVGHQFGANHTFNAGTGSCAGGNRVDPRAFEPGSGSTIMAYAGICAPNNVANNSSDYFHSVSLEEITGYITTGTGGSCPTVQPLNNTNAVMDGFTATYYIPTETPFELTAPPAFDATSDTALTFCWEQRDLGNYGGTLGGTTTFGPLFRSFPPDTSRTRIFPVLPRLLAGVRSYASEKLPTVTRTMQFGLTQRDFYQGFGAYNFPDDRITLEVTAMNPFRVTYPLGGEVWIGGSYQTIRWDASNTAASPVSCSNVDIYMSVDGGYTFPFLLKGNTPNDGSESVQIPNSPSNYVRIKVKGNGNVFFAVSESETFLDRGTVSVSTTPFTETVSLSPVPVKGSLQVSVPQSLGTVELRLLNMLGQPVWTGSASGQQVFDASAWPRGIYHMSIRNEAGFQQTRKLVLE